MTSATTFDIAATRAELEQRRAVLTAERPAVALRAAGGDASAIEQARHLTAELADIGLRLEGLALAEQEARRLGDVQKQQQAERARQERARVIAEVRAHLGREMSVMEEILVKLGECAVGIDALALELDGLESSPATPPYRRRYAAVRTLGRVRAALRCWAQLQPGGEDPRPLGDGDVP